MTISYLSRATHRAGFVLLVLTVSLFLHPCLGGTQSAPSTATVTGTVQNSDGSPVTNATVQLIGATTLTGQSDASGGFVFLKVPYGNYRVVVNAKGVGRATREHVVVAADMSVTVRY